MGKGLEKLGRDIIEGQNWNTSKTKYRIWILYYICKIQTYRVILTILLIYFATHYNSLFLLKKINK